MKKAAVKPPEKTEAAEEFVLPANIVSQIDVSRLVKEVEHADNELTSASIRSKAGKKTTAKPVFSEQLTEFLRANKLDIDNSKERSVLIKRLRAFKDHAPVIHMTFAVPADRESLQKLAQWARETVHPQALIGVGLQPALVGGVYLRTPNHVHDLSLRGKLEGQHGLLVEELEALRGAK